MSAAKPWADIDVGLVIQAEDGAMLDMLPGRVGINVRNGGYERSEKGVEIFR